MLRVIPGIIMLLKKLLAVWMMLVALVASSQAISFTFVGSTGANVTSSGSLGANGYFFQIPTYFLIGVGSKSASISYTVSADAGHRLTSVTLDPNGTVQANSAVSISAAHSSDVATYSDTSVALAQLGDSTTSLLTQQSSYSVTMNLSIVNPEADSIGKVSIMQVFYTQEPVPEPATMIGLAAGLAAFLAKKKRG